MRTFILACVIGLPGLIMIAGGIWGIIDLFRQEVRAPLKSYGGAVSMVCGGFAMLGVAQALPVSRLLWWRPVIERRQGKRLPGSSGQTK
jgi:hypothetical protein